MPTTDPLGRQLPITGDATDPFAWFRNYGLSQVGVRDVASRLEANTLLGDYNAAADAQSIPRRPLLVWRTDIDNLELHPNTGTAGEGWEYVAGRQHGATVAMSSDGGADYATLREDRWDALYAKEFRRASPGWTLTGDGIGVIIPATGMYTVRLNGLISTSTAQPRTDLGRVLVDLVVNGSNREYGAPMVDENRVGASIGPLPLSKGNQVKVEVYHATGGTRGFTGTLDIAQINAPRWVSGSQVS